HLGDKDRVNHAFGVYQPLVHVPLIIHDPLQPHLRGQAYDHPISTRRLFHTLLAAAGAASFEEERLSLFHGAPGEPAAPEVAFSEGFPLQWATGRLQAEKARYAELTGHLQAVRAVRDQSHKLIVAS